MNITCSTSGKTQILDVAELPENGGVAVAMFNTNDSIASFADASLQYAL